MNKRHVQAGPSTRPLSPRCACVEVSTVSLSSPHSHCVIVMTEGASSWWMHVLPCLKEETSVFWFVLFFAWRLHSTTGNCKIHWGGSALGKFELDVGVVSEQHPLDGAGSQLLWQLEIKLDEGLKHGYSRHS